jgi:hypothetical protein
MTANQHAAIGRFIDSLERDEARYAAAYAHWWPEGRDVAEARAESRRKPVRPSRAALLRRSIDAFATQGQW